MLRGEPAARLLLVDIGALRDADQGVMRLVYLGLGEIDVVGRDQRDVLAIGETRQPGDALEVIAAIEMLGCEIDPPWKMCAEPR